MRTSLVLGFIGVCIGGVAIAAPAKPGSQPQPQAEPQLNCPTPSFAQCTAEAYLTSACGKLRKSVCTKLVVDKLKTFHEGSPVALSAPEYKMLLPGRHELPSDLREGKYFAYPGPTTNIVKRADHQLGRTKIARLSVARMQRVSAADAAKAHRNPAWDDNGQKITSCAEYGYEQVYDLGRFIDAAAACRGDQECIFDVAFMPQTPGLADRTLTRKDGKPFSIPGSQLTPYTGIMAKNDIMAVGPGFVRSHGAAPLASTPQLAALEAALVTGEKYYRTQCGQGSAPCNDRNFTSEWQWHRALRQTTANVSPAEFEEYERRRAMFRRLMSSWHAAVQAELGMIPEEVARVLPFDARTRDPLERLDIIQRYVRDMGVQEQKFRQRATPLQLKKALGEVPREVQGSLTPALLPGPWMAAPAPMPTNTPTASPAARVGDEALARAQVADPNTDIGTAAPHAAIANPCVNYDDWGGELLKRGPLSCAIGQFLRVEWQRKLDGKKSCLDLGNRDCDWSPDMFSARFVDRVPGIDRQAQHEEECQTWTGGVLTNKNDLDEVRAYIEAMKQAVGVAKRELRAYERQGGSGYARRWDEREVMGDKQWFGAEYRYDLGFEVDVVKRSGDRVCELGGGFHASGGLDAFLIKKTFQVVDAELSSTINKGGDHKSTLKSHLTVLDKALFSEESNTTVLSVYKGESLEIPAGYRPSFTVPAGPVPITGAAWGELMYGSSLIVNAQMPVCNVTSPNFGITGSFTPFIIANARASVGVGISGIVSAGVRGALNLVTLSLPFKIGLTTGTAKVSNETQPVLNFDMSLALTLATLAGRLSFYIEFLLYEEEWELFRWRGLGPAQLTLMPPVKVALLLTGMQ